MRNLTIIVFMAGILIAGCIRHENRNSRTVVLLEYDKTMPQATYSAARLHNAFTAMGYSVVEDSADGYYRISVSIDTLNLEPESFTVVPGKNEIKITGGDKRGMIYGALSLAEDILNGVKLHDIPGKMEKPHYPMRAIKHNTSWYSYRPSSALDQHYETLRDPGYWKAFLDMMAENRFNSLAIFNLHPFVFMITPRNFPEASPFSPEEMEEWKHLHREIIRMASERAIDVYLFPFNIFVSEEFSKAHNVALKNFYPNYYCEGDTSEIVKRYIRECVTQVLQ